MKSTTVWTNSRIRRFGLAAGMMTMVMVLASCLGDGNDSKPATKLSLTSLDPDSVSAGAAGFTLTVRGTGFASAAAIQWNGVARTTVFDSSTKLTAVIAAADVAAEGIVKITVANPGNKVSSSLDLIVTSTVVANWPSLTALDPDTVVAGAAGFTLTLQGTNFVDGAVVKWNDSPRTTTFIGATQLTAAVTAEDVATAGNAQITVANPDGKGSNALTVAILNPSVLNPVPTISALGRDAATGGNAATAGVSGVNLIVQGANFVQGATVLWNGSSRTTTFTSANQVSAAISAGDLAAPAAIQVTVFNPAPGGGVSNALVFAVVPDFNRQTGGADDDLDAQTASGATPMRWHDYDKDGGVRWDYGDLQRFLTYPTVSQNVANPLHRLLRNELYVSFSDFKAAFPYLAADTSANSRISRMKKSCRDAVDSLHWTSSNPAELAQIEAIKTLMRDSTCTIYTHLIKPDLTPPARSEWVSGTFGVDEEILDGKDNDYDGFIDEDRRSATGFDDDGDALLTTPMIGNPVAAMQWQETGGHANKCPDIDTTIAMSLYASRSLGSFVSDTAVQRVFQRAFCVGSFEHRLYLARKAINTGTDSLVLSYAPFVNAPTAGDIGCRDALSKLDAAYLANQIPTEAEKALACHYKHVWTTGRPVNSEWTGGIFGIDEEITDGADNDGDGLIDEDPR